MKKICVLLAVFCLIAGAACSDDDKNSDDPRQEDSGLLVGTWEVVKIFNGETGEFEYSGEGTDRIEYYTFHDDLTYEGEVRWNDSGTWRRDEQSGIYSVKDGYIYGIVGDGRSDGWLIDKLTESDLILSWSYGSEQQYTDRVFFRRVR